MGIDPKFAWMQLLAAKLGDSDFDIPSIVCDVSVHGRPLRFALGSAGERRFLVPIQNGVLPPSLGATRNIRFSVFRGKAAGVVGLYIDILCVEARLAEVFAEFCGSVISRIDGGNDSGLAVKQAVEEFRALFEASGTKALSDSERIGLLGELWFLEQLVARSPRLIEAWTGPAGHRHDFRSGAISVEIKTSSKKGNQRVTISSIEQLSIPAGSELFLWRPVLEPAMGGAISISALLARILDRGVDKAVLEARLAALKLDLGAMMKDENQGFSFEGVSAYRVAEGFPCIALDDIGGELPTGVISLQYDVDLGAAGRWELTALEMSEVFCRLDS